MGAGAIPWTAIDQYARRYNCDEEAFEDLVYMVQQMDRTWLEFQSDEGKKAAERNKKPTGK